MVDLLELAHQILESGLSWASATAIILALIKIKDGNHKRRVNEATRRDIAAIKEALGLSNHSPPPSSKRATILSSERYFLSSRKVIQWVSQLGRKMKMNNQINYVTLIVALLGAAKLALQAFGIDVITDDMIDKSANVVAAVVTLVGVVISHRKTVTVTNQTASIDNSTPYDVDNMV